MGVKTENGPKFSFNHSALLLDTQAAKTKGKITVNFMLCPTVLKQQLYITYSDCTRTTK